MSKYVQEVLITQEQIQEMVRRLGAEISRDYAGEELLVIGILRGAFVFLADLVRAIDVPLAIDFMQVSSYGDAKESSGVVKIIKDCDLPITDRHVLIVEDIVDTGLTMNKLIELLSTRNPKSIALCAAFDKPARRKVQVPLRYRGMEIPDAFIVGYGLDYRDYYRNLPDVCVVAEEQEAQE